MKLDWQNIGASLLSAKAIGIAVGLLVLIGSVLFTFDSCGGYFWQRKTDKMLSNINAETQSLKDIQANIQKEKEAEAAVLERIRIETNQYQTAVNASDAAREETNRAIQNMQNAINGNRPVNVTAEELEKKMRELGY